MACCDGYENFEEQTAPAAIETIIEHAKKRNFLFISDFWKQHLKTSDQTIQNDFNPVIRWCQDYNIQVQIFLRSPDWYDVESAGNVFGKCIGVSSLFASTVFTQETIECAKLNISLLEFAAKYHKKSASKFLRKLGFEFIAQSYLQRPHNAEDLVSKYSFEDIAYDDEGFLLSIEYDKLKKKCSHDALNTWLIGRLATKEKKFSEFKREERFFWSTLPGFVFCAGPSEENYQAYLDNLNSDILLREIVVLLEKYKSILMGKILKDEWKLMFAFLRKYCCEQYKANPKMAIFKEIGLEIMKHDIHETIGAYEALVQADMVSTMAGTTYQFETDCIVIKLK